MNPHLAYGEREGLCLLKEVILKGPAGNALGQLLC